MTCGACAARIERQLNRLEGVEASVNYAASRATATVAEDRLPEELLEAIREIGYGARLAGAQAAPGQATTPATPDDARRLGIRLVVAAVAFMPLCDLSLVFLLLPVTHFPGWQWLLVALAAPVVGYCAWPFYVTAARGLRHGTFTMDTLVSLGILTSTGCSLYGIFFEAAPREHSVLYLFSHSVSGSCYLDVAAGVTTFLLAGRYFEAWMRRRTGNALSSLSALAVKEVAIIADDGEEVRRPVAELAVGTRFAVHPGEAVATDGEVEQGRCLLDRQMITGESIPVELGPGDEVVGGTVVLDGRIVVRATSVGSDTQLARMVRLVENAQNEKAAAQRIADRIAGVFVPVVVALAALTLAGWIVAGVSAARAIDCSLAVVIIACPCALGLATPMALVVASGAGARRGVFFKGYLGLEASQRIDTVVFDKTGTVTFGRMALVAAVPVSGVTRTELLRLVGAVEQASEHPVALAVAGAARQELGTLPPVTDFVARAGFGVEGVVDGSKVAAGRPDLLRATGEDSADLARRSEELEERGLTVVVAWRNGEPIGALGMADSPRPSASTAVSSLRRLGLRCLLLSGDNETTTRRIGAEIGVDDFRAGVVPEGKVDYIRELQAAGRCVAMVGDGVNDGPALAVADLGIAVGSGTDVAIGAADLIVIGEDLGAVASAVVLARRTISTIRGNLVWAFVYNLAALPLAACGFLNPLVAGAAMACSSAFVVWNSARLRKGAEPGPPPPPPASVVLVPG